ncbi:DUF7527 domain-containing protein [Halorussus lipolyticus]|uniref:DUF7527 domain-containing protein n=1 Tax=Halorussus lipolyticus TaxID=3034024 RepID=UPI0023E8D87F|nr:hypothetical protein [Halorussus sp. DT80]
METRTVEQVEDWDTRSFADGFAGLRELSDGEFSGAVRAGGAWLFMLNGRIIGVYEGSLDDFEDAGGTAYAAPHPSLPLLFSMQEEGGETQAKYYTNDTPLSEVDSTLTDGKFTGYVELSENVLSGDYYVAYYGGRSMSVAFVGASEQVVTGDEAFERANDEVGIYEVRDVDIEVIDVPEPDEPDESPDGTLDSPTSAPESASGDESGATGATDDGASGLSGTGGTGGPSPESGGAGRTAGTDATAGGTARETDQTADVGTEASSEPDPGRKPGRGQSATADSGAAATGTTDATEETANPASASAGAAVESVETPDSGASRPEETQSDAETDSATDTTDETDSDAFEEEAQWREATTIPSLDPDRSAGPAEEDSDESARSDAAGSAVGSGSTAPGEQSRTDDAATAGSSSSGASSGESSQAGSASRTGSQSRTSPGGSDGQSGGPDEQSQAKIQKLRSQLRQRKQQVQQLKERLSNVESERNEYKRERDALRQEVERLEAKLENAGSGGSGASGRQLSRSQAFDQTNLFVRYESKGEATLDEAAEGQVKPEEVNQNLRLEHHTQFETEGATVEGEPFEEFLHDSFEYQFVSWIIEELLYEIRDTGHRNGLKDLYESIPKIDRVDLHGSVGAGGDTDDTRQESFDIIMRDRMGNPLVVADLNDSRDPTTGDMMGALVDAADGVAHAHDELSGAFQVTESFFEPKALETAENATAGGFLSREKRESFVKLSRKRGYHLCLVESRSGGFHLNVPEL